MADIPLMSGSNGADSLYKALASLQIGTNIFKGSSSSETTSGGTETKQTLMSQDAVNAMLAQILGGTQGLASVTSGSKNAGLYNSSTNQLLVNDLLSKSAAQVALASSPTVSTKSPTTATKVTPPQMSGLGALGTIGMSIGGNILAKKYGPKILDTLGLGEEAGIPGIVGNTSIPQLSVNAGSGVGSGLGMESSFSGLGQDFSDYAAGLSFGEAGTMFDSSLADLGVGASLAEGGEFIGALGFDAGLADLGVGASLAEGGEILGTVATFAEEASALESIAEVAAVAAKIICTESHRQGLLPEGYYKEEELHLLRNPVNPTISRGYRYLATPVVHWMRKHKFVATHFSLWAKSYIDQVAFKRTNWRGLMILGLFVPVCFLVGCVVETERMPETCNG